MKKTKLGAGRKTNKEKGIETKITKGVSIYPTHKTKLIKKFKTISKALESI